MNVIGFTKVRNEAHLLKDTLDVWAQWCDRICVYVDAATDDTAAVAGAHPAVFDVIESSYYDPDRPKAETHNREVAYLSALRQCRRGDWMACFDADEHLVEFPLKSFESPVAAIAPRWYDVYITPDSVEQDYRDRAWVDAYGDRLTIPIFFRAETSQGFNKPDQRIMNFKGTVGRAGRLRHYGLGYSVEQWERKVDYYGNEWTKYSEKWKKRRGQCIREDYMSVWGTPLVRWEEAA